MIKKIDFENIQEYKNKNFSPILFEYKKQDFSVISKKSQIDIAWELLFKIFFNQFYNDHKDFLEPLFDKRIFASKGNIGFLIFSHSNDGLNNKNKIVKFETDAYVKLFETKYNNLLLLKRIIKASDLNNFKLYVSLDDDIGTPEFNKEYKKYDKKYNLKYSIFVASHINSKILTNFEKLVNYVNNEFKRRKLIGDIVLSENQEETLNKYFKYQLICFNSKPDEFIPEYPRLFALALVRYAMHNYNKTHKGEFWPYFKTDYNVNIDATKQKYIHALFEKILKENNMSYLDNIPNKIDNITMHTFVSDNASSQLFDYLFDFWRLDLVRNVDNLNSDDNSIDVFSELIKAMEIGSQDVRSHTSLLLKFPKLRTIFKNRIKRIFRLINDAFWNNTEINETGNRINHLLNLWIQNKRSSFQKEKEYIEKHTITERGEVLYHSPVIKFDVEENKIYIILPSQRLIECDEDSNPLWMIESDNTAFDKMCIQPKFKKDKISYYIDKSNVEIPLNTLLSNFKINLTSNDIILKKYEIKSSKIRLFDSNGKNIDYKNSIVPKGIINSYSDSKDYPNVLGKENRSVNSCGLYFKNFDLNEGQILILDDNKGIQIGQKLKEGYCESYPLKGVTLKYSDKDYDVYSHLPKLLFKANPKELEGISLSINGLNNRIIDFNLKEFKYEDDIDSSYYLIDLNKFINKEGLYTIFLDYPKYKKQQFYLAFAYIKNFNYSFRNSPYIFKEVAVIEVNSNLNFIELNDEKYKYYVTIRDDLSRFLFNFAEKDPSKNAYCELVEDDHLRLSTIIDNKEVKLYFYIPALYWKYNLDDEWNVKRPKDILLKELKKEKKNLYLNGPFTFSKATIAPYDNIDVPDEEAEIKCHDLKTHCYNISKIYNWFASDRSEAYRYIAFKDCLTEEIFTTVICRSVVKDVNLLANFDDNILIGDVDIFGNGSYTVSIYQGENMICEDTQIIDGKFEVKCDLKPGDYSIYIYEIDEDDNDDGFDVDTTSICLTKEPFVRTIVNVKDLSSGVILLYGYQDKKKKYYNFTFDTYYYITDIESCTLNSLIKDNTFIDGKNGEIENLYGIWNEDISIDRNSLSKYAWYKANIRVKTHDNTFIIITKALLMFPNTFDLKSMYIFVKDEADDYAGLNINYEDKNIVTGYQYKYKLSKESRRNCEMFDDNLNYFLFLYKEIK